MIIHWSEYTSGPSGAAPHCALHGETPGGHRFHICPADPDAAQEAVELWLEGEGSLEHIGDFPSETAAKIHAERVAATV